MRLLSVVLAASVWLPGCFTYSAVKKLSDPDHPVKGMSTAFVVGNVLSGAIVGGVVAAQSAPTDRGIAFAQGMAGWNLLDLCVGFPLAMIGIFAKKLNE